jgi:hypothetical protein
VSNADSRLGAAVPRTLVPCGWGRESPARQQTLGEGERVIIEAARRGFGVGELEMDPSSDPENGSNALRWWRRRESNPRPEARLRETLQA